MDGMTYSVAQEVYKDFVERFSKMPNFAKSYPDHIKLVRVRGKAKIRLDYHGMHLSVLTHPDKLTTIKIVLEDSVENLNKRLKLQFDTMATAIVEDLINMDVEYELVDDQTLCVLESGGNWEVVDGKFQWYRPDFPKKG